MSTNGSINFALTDEQKQMQQLARDFSRSEIAPAAEHYDKTHEYPWPVVKKAQELGLTAMSVPETYGGLGLNLVEEVVVGEELVAAVCPNRPRKGRR
jgi:acyl-CoA dehydrogenase